MQLKPLFVLLVLVISVAESKVFYAQENSF